MQSKGDKIYPNLSKLCYWEFDRGKHSYHWYYYIEVGDDRNYHITASGITVECLGIDNGRPYEQYYRLDFIPKEQCASCKFGLTESQLLDILKLPLAGSPATAEDINKKFFENLWINVDN